MWVHDLCEWILKWVFVWEEQLQVSHSSYLQATCVSEMREGERVCVRSKQSWPVLLKGSVGGLQSPFEWNVTL